jgi:cytochrome c biogenesis protein CcmG, thiol:disulfide interchange protein DsbE
MRDAGSIYLKIAMSERGKRNRIEKLMAVIAVVAVVGGLLFALAPESFWRSATLTPQNERRAAPEISLPDLNGRVWNLSDHSGRVVLINYWATWCPPCRAETPALVKLANELSPRGLEVVGMSLDETKDVIPPFVAAYKIPYPILSPPEGSRLTAQVHSIPTTLLIDKQGRIAKLFEGAASEADLRDDVERLLAE